jgi:hypothetical protein
LEGSFEALLMPMSREVSRFSVLATITAFVIFAGWTYRNATWEEETIPPPVQPSAGQQCTAQGGNQAYCRCLERLASARSAAGLPAPRSPELDDRVLREAVKRPDMFPIINADTKRCILDPGLPPSRAPGPTPSQRPAPGDDVSRA